MVAAGVCRCEHGGFAVARRCDGSLELIPPNLDPETLSSIILHY